MPSRTLMYPCSDAALEPDGHHDEGWQHGEHRDCGQADVRGKEEHRDHDHRQTLDGELGQAVLEQLLQVLDVTCHAAHDDAGLLLGEEVEREPLEMAEDRDAQVVHDP